MPLNGHYANCEICGAFGHRARSCGLKDLEARRDPYGEQARIDSHRRRKQKNRKPIPPGTSLANSQSSPRFGV